MMTHRHGKRFLQYAAIPALWLCCVCGNRLTDLSGGSQVGNPAVAVGCVQDVNQRPVGNARVYLVSPDFNGAGIPIIPPSADSGQIVLGRDSSGFLTFTDASGRYVFHVPEKEFNLFIEDTATDAVGLRRHVAINDTSVNLGMETVKQPGIAIVNIPDTMFAPNSYLIVPGTPIALAVPAAGPFMIPVPGDTVSLGYYTPRTNTVKQAGDSSRFVVRPGDTVELSAPAPAMFTPVLRYQTDAMVVPALLPDTLSTDVSAVMLIASGPYPSKTGGVEYQFFYFRGTGQGGVTSLSNWSDDNFYSLSTISSGQYGVSCRIRINDLASDWIPTRIIIKR